MQCTTEARNQTRVAAWNLLMVNFLARSNVYPVHVTVPISIDIFVLPNPDLVLEWNLLAPSRPPIRLPTAEAVSQTLLIFPEVLSQAAVAAGPSGWVSVAFRIVSRGGALVADDCLDLRLVPRTRAHVPFDFRSPPGAARQLPPRVVHLVHLVLSPAHRRQLAAVRVGRAARGTAPPGGCDATLLAVVRGAAAAVPGAEMLLHTDGPLRGAACPELARAVRAVPVVAPAAVGGRPVHWHQHQADVVIRAPRSESRDLHTLTRTTPARIPSRSLHYRSLRSRSPSMPLCFSASVTLSFSLSPLSSPSSLAPHFLRLSPWE
jgi:hypothetical protein